MRVFIGLKSTDERQHLSRHAVFSVKRGKSQARNGLLPEGIRYQTRANRHIQLALILID
jgi:hypothetical protein